ncbi:MAG TPA: ABC transporter ATP-binding protein [Candidatus Angelobacter sp.]|nr:ABC transporter ATP-binding protein [Candidatus Angelobacter sp.]
MSSAIRTENLVRKFRKVEALQGMNLNVPLGAIYALVGPNGAGKSTAIKILMNIIEPTSGRAEVLGTDSRRLAGRSFADIGYVSENQELPLWMRVGEFLSFLRPFYPSWDRDLEEELVKKFDLPLDRRLRHLSRGMRMKAALASSLAYHPKLIVMDEPFSGLDPLVRDELIEGLLDRTEEATVLVSSHDLGEIESFASHVGYLENGSLLFSDEMNVLASRFREVELTFDSPVDLPPDLPESWMQPSTSASVVRFIESRFDVERSPMEVRWVFADHRNMTFNPMSLRSIFLAIAKEGRRPNRGGLQSKEAVLR